MNKTPKVSSISICRTEDSRRAARVSWMLDGQQYGVSYSCGPSEREFAEGIEKCLEAMLVDLIHNVKEANV